MELPTDLNERVKMAIIGYFIENPKLIKNIVITIDDISNIFRYEKRYEDDDEDEPDEEYKYYMNTYYYINKFGPFALSNGYLNITDETDIAKYVNSYDDEPNEKDRWDINYSDLVDINDRIDYFSNIYCIENLDTMIELMTDIYLNRDNRTIVLK